MSDAFVGYLVVLHSSWGYGLVTLTNLWELGEWLTDLVVHAPE